MGRRILVIGRSLRLSPSHVAELRQDVRGGRRIGRHHVSQGAEGLTGGHQDPADEDERQRVHRKPDLREYGRQMIANSERQSAARHAI
jgi:hypothetical protein